MAPLRLPAPPEPPAARTLLPRLRAYLLHTWRGRVLLACLAVWITSETGVAWPGLISVPAHIALFFYSCAYSVRLALWILRRLLYKIRTKLLMSYVLIGFVPIVLLTVFLLLAGLLFHGLAVSSVLTLHVERQTETLRVLGTSVLGQAPDASLAPRLGAPLESLAGLHPGARWSYLCGGRPVAVGGATPLGDSPPRARPAWLTSDFSGVVRAGELELLRVALTRGPCTLFLDLPVDRVLFASLEPRAGIVVLAVGGEGRQNERGMSIDNDPEDFRRVGTDPDARLTGVPLMTTLERTDWGTGEKDADPVMFLFRPGALMRRLSPATLDMGDVFVRLLTVVGVFFLVMYGVALLFGLLLARSITGSVHALAQGTQRVRRGEFEHRIRVRSRDQLGELAESFNLMAAGIQQALLDQAEKQRLEEELRIARQIQMSLLPRAAVTHPGLRISALCLPAAEVGGDYYDLLPLDETRLGVVVADVSGKGTSAALYMAELKGLVLSLSRVTQSPKRLLAEANRILHAHTDSRTFVTMTYAVVDVAAACMRYARAGHNPLLHYEAVTGRARWLTPRGIGLGLDRGERFEELLEEAELELRQGDVFLFFTDGLSEAMNARSELFGEGRLQAILERSEALTTEELKETILSEIRAFVGDEAQHDDMTLVLLQVA
jgi:serine phosphatase RsbU (regulator of sigma subunit)